MAAAFYLEYKRLLLESCFLVSSCTILASFLGTVYKGNIFDLLTAHYYNEHVPSVLTLPIGQVISSPLLRVLQCIPIDPVWKPNVVLTTPAIFLVPQVESTNTFAPK